MQDSTIRKNYKDLTFSSCIQNSTRNPKISLISSQLSRKPSNSYRLFLSLAYTLRLYVPLFIDPRISSCRRALQRKSRDSNRIKKGLILYTTRVWLLEASRSFDHQQPPEINLKSLGIKPKQSWHHPMAIRSYARSRRSYPIAQNHNVNCKKSLENAMDHANQSHGLRKMHDAWTTLVHHGKCLCGPHKTWSTRLTACTTHLPGPCLLGPV